MTADWIFLTVKLLAQHVLATRHIGDHNIIIHGLISFTASKEKQLRKGVREVQKFLRKGEKG